MENLVEMRNALVIWLQVLVYSTMAVACLSAGWYVVQNWPPKKAVK